MADRVLKEKRCEGKPGPLCGNCTYRDEPFVPATEGRPGGVMIIGSGPGEPDVKAKQRYSGYTGKRLQKQLSYAGILLSDCWVDDVVACHVPKTRKPTKTAMRCCRPILEDAMARCKPSTIITLGSSAFEGFYQGKLANYHGAKIEGDGYTLVPMFQPNAYDDNPDLLRTIHDDYAGLNKRKALEPIVGDYGLSKVWFKPSNDRLSIDTETTGLDLRSKLLGMSFCDTPGKAVYIEDRDVRRGLNFEDHVVMHNAKYDLGICQSNEVALVDSWRDVDDTMLLAYCMNEKPLGLKALAIQKLGLEMTNYRDIAEGDDTLVGVDPKDVAKYSCADADATLRLWEYLWNKAAPWQRTLYEEIDKPIVRMSAKMQLRGVNVDVPYFEKLSVELGRKVDESAAKILKRHGLDRKTLDSPTALAQFLTQKLHRHIPSTEHFAMEKLKGEPVIDDILEYRPLFKLKHAFVDSLLNLQRAGLVFPQFSQTRTSTGRSACSDPNLQQLPKKGDKTVRAGFTAPEGFLVACLDNSQIDLRSLAYLSKDEELNRIFDNDLDAHDETAAGMDLDSLGVDAELKRRLAKTANFLTVFGGGAYTLALKTGVSEEIAYDFMDQYWERHQGVQDWVKATHDYLANNGYVETAYKRRRYIPKVFTSERGAAFREGQNMPVQGTSADVLKLQMAAVEKVCLPFGQIHDELDFYVPKKGAKEMVQELVRKMETVDCPFKLRVEASIGPSMGELEKMEL